jgi:oxygen-independent coproporphyrinogen-3 oxidase
VLQATGNQGVAGFHHATIHALYAHVPFCFHKCHYCDFYSLVEPAGNQRHDAFADALIAELNHHAATRAQPLRPRTVFVGGGTPTLLPAAAWRRLLDAMATLGLLEDTAEFTVEANPETVTPDLIQTLTQGGVNRLSMGAQSFQPQLLKALERWHDPASVGRAIATARDAGIRNLNLDLIFAIPGQTMAQLDADLDAALALSPTHLSCYNLTYEPNTALTSKLRLGRVRPVDQDTEAAMYGRVIARLDDAGFEHYEISNWARKDPARSVDNRCQHNLAYWRNLNWLAIGPAASGHVDGYRWKNQAHLGRYLSGAPTPPRVDEERLPPEARVGEVLMMGLRLLEGVAGSWIDEHVPVGHPRHRTIDELLSVELLQWAGRGDDRRLRLTRRGLFVADAVVARLL